MVNHIAFLNQEGVDKLFENALENIVILDAQGVIISFNQSRGLGYNNTADLIGKNIFSLIDPLYHKTLISVLSSKRKAVQNNYVYEVAFKQAGGRRIWYELRAVPFVGEGGKKNFLLFARNISKRVRLENRLKKINLHLEETIQQKTMALQEAVFDLESFSFSVSHDLKAPLRAIKGYSMILAEEIPDDTDDEILDAVQSLKRNVDKMEKLIGDILNFSRIGRTTTIVKPVDFKKIFADKYKELLSIEPPRTIDFQIAEKIPHILFDAPMAQLLAQNLLSNAIKYTSKKEFAKIRVGFQDHGKTVDIFVRDNGAGFDEKFKDKLFAVFQRLHSEKEFPGTGVGLAIVKRIMKKNGGEIRGEGRVNEGATFYISLPKKSVYYEKS